MLNDFQNLSSQHFAVLIKMILNKKLSDHESTLKNFNTLFRQIDKDRDGKIDYGEFCQLMGELNIGLSELQINEFFMQLNHSGEGQIHYSHIIGLLSTTENR